MEPPLHILGLNKRNFSAVLGNIGPSIGPAIEPILDCNQSVIRSFLLFFFHGKKKGTISDIMGYVHLPGNAFMIASNLNKERYVV